MLHQIPNHLNRVDFTKVVALTHGYNDRQKLYTVTICTESKVNTILTFANEEDATNYAQEISVIINNACKEYQVNADESAKIG